MGGEFNLFFKRSVSKLLKVIVIRDRLETKWANQEQVKNV